MILLFDNHDAYTFNLYQLISEVAGELPLVVRAEHSEAENLAQRVSAREFSHVVISPEPGTPEDPHDFDAVRELIEAAINVPVLGVCLGQQGLGLIDGTVTLGRAIPPGAPIDRAQTNLGGKLPRTRDHNSRPEGKRYGSSNLEGCAWGIEAGAPRDWHGDGLRGNFRAT